MISPSLETAKLRLGKQRKSLVLTKKINADTITPVLTILKIREHYPDYHFLFESVEKGSHKGRHSIIGIIPELIWKTENNSVYVNLNPERAPEQFKKINSNPFDSLKEIINQSRIDDIPLGVSSGLFGYMAYDMVRFIEKLPNRNLKDQIKIPDSIFIRPKIIIVFDALFDTVTIHSSIYYQDNIDVESSYREAAKLIEKVAKILSSNYLVKNNSKKSSLKVSFTSNFSKSDYCQKVRKAQEYIKNGDIFQVLPSQRFTSKFDQNSSFSFYRSLRSINPSPFLFYLKFPDFCLTGSSPEIMISLKDRKVTLRPLAGTRKRGNDEAENQQNANDLLNDQKELAEHLMLIDLGRHDVSRVCKAKSVKVTEKMVIENYSHVMHISSNVEGILDKKKYGALDVLISGFPAGTISGAPKIRAMEIIEELENEKRGFYSGCVGYFSANGDMETCITLRSALIKNNKIYIQSGAGVVFDSDPESEYKECLNKAQALIKAAENLV